MKKTAKIISLILVIILLLSGCTNPLDGVLDLLSGKNVFEIEGSIPDCDGTIDARFFGDELLLLKVVPKDDENYEYCVYKIDAKHSKLVSSNSISGCPVGNPYGFDEDSDGNPVIYGTKDFENDKIIRVLLSLDTLETSKETAEYKPSVPGLGYKDSRLGILFNDGDYIASYESEYLPGNSIHAFAFHDDPDTAVFADDLDFSFYDTCGKLAAGKTNLGFDSNNREEEIVVYDFENHILVNRYVPEQPEETGKTKTVISVFLNDRYALIEEETADYDLDEYSRELKIWHFLKNRVDEPFAATVKTADDIEKSNGRMCESIKDKYGINIYINSDKFDFYGKDEDYYLTNDARLFEVYVLLLRISAFIDLMPEGFVKEMYTNLKDCEFKGFDIFIGGNINGIASAYAMTYRENLTIVFSTGTVDFRTVAHEFMHAMDARIEDYVYTKSDYENSLYAMWCELNPEGFEYLGLEEESRFYDSEENEQYFVSSYAATTDAEDRAEIFSYLFAHSVESSETPDWYIEKKPLSKKTDFLLKMLREAYPSLKNVKTAQWEKPLEKKSVIE